LTSSEVASRKSENFRKRPGLQGSIDDAFTKPFLIVKGSGKAWSEVVQKATDHHLQIFQENWACYFRGDAPCKAEVEVTDADISQKNLILFGEPASNILIEKVVALLPIVRTSTHCGIGSGLAGAPTFDATTHWSCLIHPNPLAGGDGHYIVIISGYTFGAQELKTLNYLLFPRIGDWAVLSGQPGSVVSKESGIFDETWRRQGIAKTGSSIT